MDGPLRKIQIPLWCKWKIVLVYSLEPDWWTFWNGGHLAGFTLKRGRQVLLEFIDALCNQNMLFFYKSYPFSLPIGRHVPELSSRAVQSLRRPSDVAAVWMYASDLWACTDWSTIYYTAIWCIVRPAIRLPRDSSPFTSTEICKYLENILTTSYDSSQ